MFFAAAVVNLLTSIVVAAGRPGWMAVSLAAHLAFNYRIVRARHASAIQRAIDLERFRQLVNERLQ